MYKKSFRLTLLLFLGSFAFTVFVLAQLSSQFKVTNRDRLIVDTNNNGLADSGDVIRYTVVFANCSDQTIEDVRYTSEIDENTQLDPNSFTLSGLQPASSEFCGEQGQQPAPENPTATPIPSVNALVTDDATTVTNGGTNTQNIIANDAGEAPLQVISFGDSPATVGTFPADGATVGSFPAAGGGTIDVTIDATGNLNVTGNGTTGTGSVTIYYEIQAGNGTTDVGQITVTFGDFPTAVDDTLATLGAGNQYNTDVGVTLNIGAGTGLLNNDTFGTPAGALTLWGGGDAGPTVTFAAGNSTAFAGGTLTVNADGSFDLVNPTIPGVYTFDYILDNGIGNSQATVEIYVNDPPVAQADAANANIAQTNNYPAPFLFNDNGSGADTLGAPPATIGSFGGGTLGGAVTDNAAGTTVAIPVIGGTLTVNADGSFVVDNPTAAGVFTFNYQLDNGVGTSVATVTVTVNSTPTTQADAFNVLIGNNLAGDLIADNGSGTDDPGVPAFVSLTFGAGDLGGVVTNNAGGASVALAGGTLTVNNDGTLTLNGATTPGTYNFDYQLTNANGTSNISTVTINVQSAPVAQDDAIIAVVGQVTNIPAPGLFNDNGSGADNLGTPVATLLSFGSVDLGGAGAGDNAAGSTVAIPVFGGTLTVNADSSVTINNPTASGTFTFDYLLDNGAANDTATVTVTINEAPIAQDDTYTFLFSMNQNVGVGTGLFVDNGSGADAPGFPVATLVSFGGGSLAGDATTNAAGAGVALAGGTLTVNTDGSWTLTGQPFTPGTYTFDYRLTNTAGSSDATVTLIIQDPPVAQADALTATVNIVNNYGAGTLSADNGSGADNLGTPAATLVNFGGGSLGGVVTTNAAGATVAFAGGTVTVNADGSLVINNPTTSGTFNFDYRLQNASGFSDATVTVTINAAPIAQNDTYTFLFSADQNVGVGTGLFVDNGSGADNLGFPVATLVSFGGGSLAGDATTNAAGAGVALAGGTLTVNTDGSWTLTGQPFTPGTYTFDYRIQNAAGFSDATVTLVIQDPPVAQADALTATINIVNNYPANTLFNDNGSGADALGTPAGNIVSFGGGTLGGTAATNAAGNTVAFAGGNITVNANGSLTITNPTTSGTFNFDYRLQNASGFSDATVTVTINAAPIAQNDTYTFLFSADQNVGVGTGLFVDNSSGADNLGFPVATLVSFGGGSLAGDATTNAAGAGVALAGGTLTVNTDGSWTLTGQPFTPGTYTFDYRIQNAAGSSDATVTLVIQDPPVAQADALVATVNIVNNYGAGTLSADNGSGADNLGTPAATVVNFGGGSLGGVVTTNAAGATVAFAGGTVTVNADGSLAINNPTTSGVFTFDYRIQNASGFSDATVTVTIQQAPVAQDDTYTFLFSVNQNVGAGAGLFVDNGSGADAPGFPVATLVSFGGGDLGGTVVTNATGASVALAGGTLTVNTDGSWTLTGQPFIQGTYTFDYRIQNAVGFSDATVTLIIENLPVARPDALTATVNIVNNYVASTLFNDNGSGADTLGAPAGTITSYGGGTLGGTAASFADGSTQAFAGGTITVNANGSLTITNPTTSGTFTFDYRLENANGFSDATVTVNINSAPNGFDDTAATVTGGTSTVGSTPFHIATNGSSLGTVTVFVDNGSGADNLGFPSAPADAPADVINNIILGGTPNAATGTIGGGAIAIGGGGSIEITAGGAVNLVPPTGFAGLIEFDYTLANSVGTDATPATVTFAVGDRPVCVADAYAATGNISINTTNIPGSSVLVNDTGGALSVTAVQGAGGNIGVNTATTSAGTVNMTAAGEFNYTPPTGFTGADTFTYTINNGFNVPSQCTVTVTVTNMIYFMDSGATAGGDGSLARPYQTIAEHNGTPPVANSNLFIEDRGAAYNGNLTLVNGQRVIGEGSTGALFGAVSNTGFTLAPLSNTVPYANTGNAADWAPITNIAGNAITANTGNTLTGVDIGNTGGYGIINNGGTVGTLNISQSQITGTGGLFSLTNGGTFNGTFTTLTSTGHTAPMIQVTNMAGTVTNTVGAITHAANVDTVAVVGGTINMTLASTITKTGTNTLLDVSGAHTGTLIFNSNVTNTAGGGDGIQLNNADGTYTFSGTLQLGNTTAGVNIINGSGGNFNVFNGGSGIELTQGIPFRINASTMNVDYNGNITHRNPALISARTIEIIAGTGTISFDGTLAVGDAGARATAEVIFLSDTGAANPIHFNYVDGVTSDTRFIVSEVSGLLSVNRLRINCAGDVGDGQHCMDISDTTSADVTVEMMFADLDDGGETGGAISLVNTPGTWTIEDISLFAGGSLNGRFTDVVFGNNFGTLNISTVDSPTSPFGINTRGIFVTGAAAFNLTNGTANIAVTTIDAIGFPDHGINLVNVDGPLFRASGNVTLSAAVGANENIMIDNVGITTIDIGTDGTTNNNVNLNNRQTFGVSATRNGATTTVRFGNTNIPDPNATGLNQVDPTPIPAWVTFATLTP